MNHRKKERKNEMMRIKNLPDYANDYKYVVAREVDGDWWFWGAYNVFEKARSDAWRLGGEVFTEWCAA